LSLFFISFSCAPRYLHSFPTRRSSDLFLGAALLTLLAVGIFRARLPRGRELAVSALYGVLAFTLSFGLFFWGTRRVPAGIASVIIGSVPLLTLLLAVLQRLERFRIRGVVGAVLAISGIVVIS